MSNPILEAARSYVGRGFSVIPVKGESGHIDTWKKAAVCWTQFQQRRPTDSELRRWFGNGQYGLAIVTGSISGIDVIDCDRDAAVQYVRRHLPKAPMVRTGRGAHFYYKHRDNTRNFQSRKDMEGIDLRAEGGYVIAPPTIHRKTGTPYRWEDGCGLDDVTMAILPEIILAPRSTHQDIPPGRRNNTLASLAGRWHEVGLSREEAHQQAIAWRETQTDPLPLEETRKTVESIYRTARQSNASRIAVPFVKLPKSILSRLTREYLGNYDTRVLMAIYHKTLAWGKDKDTIAHTQIASMTGIAKPNVTRSLRSLAEKNFITCQGRSIELVISGD